MSARITRAQLEDAILDELEALGKPPHGEVDEGRFAAAVADRLRLVGALPPPLPGFVPRRYDLRHEQDFRYPGGKRKTRFRRGQPVRRDPQQVVGIMLHQSAVEFGVSPRQIAASDGDVELALARRGLDVACHAIAFRAGIYVLTHDLEVYVHHGNALNATTLGLEVGGRYPGLEDDPTTLPREDLQTTWGGDPTELTAQTIATACAALSALLVEGRAARMPITKVWAHRQSSLNRRSDPGAAIWQEVVLDYAVRELGLRTYPATVVGEGYQIPGAWDPDGVGPY